MLRNYASAVQPDFNRAMALYHSFAWDDAMKAFDGIVKADKSCGMAHWGRAMVMLDNPFIWPGNLQPAPRTTLRVPLRAATSRGGIFPDPWVGFPLRNVPFLPHRLVETPFPHKCRRKV